MNNRQGRYHLPSFFLWIVVAVPLLSGSLAAQTPARFIGANEKTILRRLAKPMQQANVPYPPRAVRLAVFKAERKTELWLPDNNGKWRFVKSYAFTASSGKQGPKVYYGDLQIPEGIYSIDSMILSKAYHLAMHVGHPNQFDLAMVELEGRDPEFMSTGIYVHGGAVSYGCVVIGDRNIEEVFLLAYKAGQENTQVMIFPHDTDRKKPEFAACNHCPVWYGELMRQLTQVLPEFYQP